jgi:hypothetical protein
MKGSSRAEGQVTESDEGSATFMSAHRFILLAESHQAVETDHSICARALAAATLESLQVADGPSKLISSIFFKIDTPP